MEQLGLKMSNDDFNGFKNPYADKTVTTRRNPRETGLLGSDAGQVAKPSTVPQGTATLGDTREVILVVRGMIERVMIREQHEVKLGRFEPSMRNPDELDLTPYGAMDRGVSRVHARIHIENNQLFITDLASTNGTYIGGVKVPANVATPLRKGDELTLGRLPIQVMFR
jgi:hypothetical protein